jgi:hypothetical protein
MKLEERIDEGYVAWARLICAHPWTMLVASLACVIVLGSYAPGLRTENSSESYLHSDDPASIEYEAFQRQFGQDDRVLLAVRTDDVFAPEFLLRLRALHEDLEENVPYLEEVTSLINIRNTRGEGDELIVGDLLEDWPEGAAGHAELRERVLANPLYVDNVVSRDGRLATLSVEPVAFAVDEGGMDEALAGFDDPAAGNTGPHHAEAAEEPPFLHEDQKRELVRAVWPVIERHAGPDFEIHTVGAAVLAEVVTTRMKGDAGRRMSATLLVMVVFLFVLFRRVSGIVYPLLVVVAALVSTVGSMVLLDIPFSLVVSMLPVFTTCVCICNSVHVLVLVYQQLARGDSKQDALAHAFRHSGLAILMTSLTTGAGVLSFTIAELANIQDLGVSAGIGVFFAFFYAMTLLPACIVSMPMSASPRVGPMPTEGPATRALTFIGDFSVRRARWILSSCAIGSIFLAWGISQAQFSHNPMNWMWPDDPLRVDTELVDQSLRGASTLEVMLSAPSENYFRRPEGLQRFADAIAEAELIERDGVFVGKATSLVDVVRETHQALNANDPRFYVIPEDAALLSQELLLFENSGSDDLEKLTDGQFSRVHATLRMPNVDGVLYRDFLVELEALFRRHMGEEVDIVLTGRTALAARTFTAMVESLVRSYAFALIVITPLMMLLIGDIRLGLISMIPNLLPVAGVLAVMGALGLTLDSSTIVMGAVIIGLAVDDTIHFLHRYRRELATSGNPRQAVRETLTTTGSALLFTSIVLCSGFVVMGSFSSMVNSMISGYLTALGIAIAFIADILVTPALISVGLRVMPESTEVEDAVLAAS